MVGYAPITRSRRKLPKKLVGGSPARLFNIYVHIRHTLLTKFCHQYTYCIHVIKFQGDADVCHINTLLFNHD